MSTPMTPTLIPFEGLASHFGITVSRATVHRMVSDGRLPKPLKTSPTRSGRLFWRVSEVEEHLARWRNSAELEAA
jgi:predicted DNA-binding transcriptional regulator AlpA